MSKQKIMVKIKPKVLEWIIDTSGYKNKELAKKLDVSETTLENWKKKSVDIKIEKLERFAHVVKRPLAIFFIQTPPIESKLIDYSKSPKDDAVKFTHSTLLSIRNARYLQSIARELFKMNGTESKPKTNQKITLKTSPNIISKTERKKLGFESKDILLSRKSIDDFYNTLRRQIESMNIFVFQNSMSIKEVSGLTISNRYPHVIVINSNDSYQTRIFSLLHEYAHILLRKDGTCIPKVISGQSDSDNTQRIESWCNNFAVAVLMPKEQFLKELTKLEQEDKDLKNIIGLLATKFRTSKLSAAIRVKTLTEKDISRYEFQKIYDEFEDDAKHHPKEKKQRLDAVDVCINRKGQKFVSLVIDSKQSKNINSMDVIEYLDLDLKYLKELQAKIE